MAARMRPANRRAASGEEQPARTPARVRLIAAMVRPFMIASVKSGVVIDRDGGRGPVLAALGGDRPGGSDEAAGSPVTALTGGSSRRHGPCADGQAEGRGPETRKPLMLGPVVPANREAGRQAAPGVDAGFRYARARWICTVETPVKSSAATSCPSGSAASATTRCSASVSPFEASRWPAIRFGSARDLSLQSIVGSRVHARNVEIPRHRAPLPSRSPGATPARRASGSRVCDTRGTSAPRPCSGP